MNFSKVLIINGQSLYEKNATGITLRSLFNTWPPESLLEVCLQEPREYNTNHCRISSLILPPISQPINWLVRKTAGLLIAPRFNQSITNDQRQGRERTAERKETMKEIVRGILDASPLLVYDKTLLHAVDNFKPDIIYTMGAGITPLKLALFFSDRYKCKIVLHCMDNWRDTLYTSSFLIKPIKKMLNHYLNMVEKRMKIGLGISEKMSREYSLRSGHDYKAVMNCITGPLLNAPVIVNNRDINITYTGGMHLNRWKTLLKVETCICSLLEKGIPTMLRIYTTDKDREKYEGLFNKSTTKFMEFLPHDKVQEAYHQADILLHIEAFHPKIINYTKYSISTKIPEYMSAGKPILCFAPPTLAVYEYINETGVGGAVSTSEEFIKCVEDLITCPDLRLSCAKKGLETVLQNHTEKVVAERLRSVMKV